MKTSRSRLAQYVTALAGLVLFGVVGLSVSASAGASPPTRAGAQSLSAARADSTSFLSNPAQWKRGKLSARLQQLSQPSVSKASVEVQAATVGLPLSGPGSLLRAAGGKQVVVYVRVSGSAASASEAIENAGATVINASKRYGVVTAAVSPTRLQALGKLSGVASAWEALAPMFSVACPSGVVSEGDSQLGAASARSTYAVDGSGVTVGVLSDSFDVFGGAAAGVSAGELPGTGNPCGYTTPLSVLADDFTATGLDEGRAMLEVVHDLAPGAAFAFATAYGTDVNPGIYGMADNIRALRDTGAKIITDDVTYFDEPMFQKGPIDAAVDDVTASGVSYFSSAGNSNLVVGGRNVGSYEAPAYRPTTCPDVLSGSGYLDCHDFDPTAGIDTEANYTLSDGGYLAIDLQWAEPWNGVSTDLDVYLIDADTGDVLDWSVNFNPGASGTQEPFEYMGSYANNTGASEHVEVVIARWSGTAARSRLKYVITRSEGVTSVEHNRSRGADTVGPTIFGHNGGQNTISTAAVRYSDSTTPEEFSSHGPVTYYYGPVSGTTPAAALSSPLVLSKPDLAATDCARTSFFYQLVAGVWRFCGTSEAAPHAAAVAALMLDKDPALAPSQVLARLQTTADAVGNGGTSDVVGSGLIDALAAVGVSTPTLAFSQSNYSISETGPSATITINRTGDTSGAVSVHVATADGSATAGSDYTAVSQDVSFAVGETSKTVSIPITDDGRVESSETASLFLSGPSTGAALGNPRAATLTIEDNDANVSFGATSYSVKESAGSAAITVGRTGVISGTASVHIATANGTARAGADYTAISQTVSFAAGEYSKTVNVPITSDKLLEPNETLNLTLSSPSANNYLSGKNPVTLAIINSPGRIASAKPTKASFKIAQARAVKLVIAFSPASKKFNYLLSFKRGVRWVTVKSVKKNGNFAGTRRIAVKSLFGTRPIKSGRYRLTLTADANSQTRRFNVT